MKRLRGLAETAARRAAAEPAPCALCGRALGARIEQHHVVPKSEGGRTTEPVHPICHRALHAALSNPELARLGSLAAARENEAVARFLRWVADKPPDFHAPTRWARG